LGLRIEKRGAAQHLPLQILRQLLNQSPAILEIVAHQTKFTPQKRFEDFVR